MDKKHLEFISLTGGDQDVCLKLFQDTSLRDTAYVKVKTLHEMIEFDYLKDKIVMYYWEEKTNKDGEEATYFSKLDTDQWLSVNALIKDCDEVRAYCKKYFPELVI